MIRYIAASFVELFFEQFNRKVSFNISSSGVLIPSTSSRPSEVFHPMIQYFFPPGVSNSRGSLIRKEPTGRSRHKISIGEYQGETWLLPDTAIASGSTIAFFLRNGFAHHLPKQVYVFTACGSLEGIQRIYQECQKKGVELIPVFSQCIFEVSGEGNLPALPLTDLPVTSPGSITTETFYEKAFHRYQGTRMCCVGDIGESLDDPIQYSIHTLWEMQVLGMDPKKEDWDAWTVDVRERKLLRRKSPDFKPGPCRIF